jgi:hypothetical protein
MHEIWDMLPTQQSDFLFDKFVMRFDNSLLFMQWLTAEASGLSSLTQSEFIDKLRSCVEVQIPDPPMGCSLEDFIKWFRLARKGMGRTARENFVKEKFTGHSKECDVSEFFQRVIAVTRNMDDEPRIELIYAIRTGKRVEEPNETDPPPMGCSFIDFVIWLGPLYPDEDDDDDAAREEFFANTLPGLPKTLRERRFHCFLDRLECASMQVLDMMDERAFLDRVRVCPELDTFGRELVLEPVDVIPEPPPTCSCEEFLQWCRKLDPETLYPFLKQKVAGKPKCFTPLEFLDWATRETRNMGDEAQKEFFKRLLTGPEIEPYNVIIEDPPVYFAPSSTDYYFSLIRYPMNDACWKMINDKVWSGPEPDD